MLESMKTYFAICSVLSVFLLLVAPMFLWLDQLKLDRANRVGYWSLFRENAREMKWLILAFWLSGLVPVCVQADAPRPMARVINEHKFESADAAARAGLKAAIKVSTQHEAGGLVYNCEGVFVYTDPVTNRSLTYVLFDYQVPMDCEVAAMYHTHPGTGRDLHMLSSQDIHNMHRLSVPSYIVVVKTRMVSVYQPGVQL